MDAHYKRISVEDFEFEGCYDSEDLQQEWGGTEIEHISIQTKHNNVHTMYTYKSQICTSSRHMTSC